MTQKPAPKSKNSNSKRSSAVAVVMQTSPCVSSFPIVSDKKQDISTASAEGLFVSPSPTAENRTRPPKRQRFVPLTQAEKDELWQAYAPQIKELLIAMSTRRASRVAPAPSVPLVAGGGGGNGGGVVVGEQGKRSKSKRS
jgi:hypothetical protein